MEKLNWKRTGLLSGGITGVLGAVALAVVSFLDRGTVIVNSVPELIEAIQDARPDDIIVIGTNGSPYNLSVAESMHRTGHLYIDKRIKIRGQGGRPSDVVLKGSTNRIMYLRAQGIKIANLTFEQGNCSGYYKPADIKESPSDYRKGGAICCGLATNEVEVINCNFKRCVAEYGGAVAKNSGEIDSTIRLKNVVIEGCYAYAHGGGCYGIGAIEGSTFYANDSGWSGGAVANVEIVKNCSFTDNSADKGGSIGYKSTFKGGTVTKDWSWQNPPIEGELPTEKGYGSGYLLKNSYAEGMEIGVNGAYIPCVSMFHNSDIVRCKISAANAYLFSGKYMLKTSLIYNGDNIVLHRSSTNENLWVNCTIVSNQNYKIFSTYNYDYYFKLAVQNCLFFGNSQPPVRKKIEIKKNILYNKLSEYSNSWIYNWYHKEYGSEDPDMWEVYEKVIYINTGDTPTSAEEIANNYVGETYEILLDSDFDISEKDYGCIGHKMEHVYGEFENSEGWERPGSIYKYNRNNLEPNSPGFLGTELSPEHPYALSEQSVLKNRGYRYPYIVGTKDLRGVYAFDSNAAADMPIGCYLPMIPRAKVGFRVVIR